MPAFGRIANYAPNCLATFGLRACPPLRPAPPSDVRSPHPPDKRVAIWQHHFMRIGVISDTHGHTLNTLAAVRLLESLEVAAVLHAGDVGAPEIPKLLI